MFIPIPKYIPAHWYLRAYNFSFQIEFQLFSVAMSFLVSTRILEIWISDIDFTNKLRHYFILGNQKRLIMKVKPVPEFYFSGYDNGLFKWLFFTKYCDYCSFDKFVWAFQPIHFASIFSIQGASRTSFLLKQVLIGFSSGSLT